MATTDRLRAEVERHLDEQAEMLAAVRGLIEDKIPFSEWTVSEQAAFITALQPPGSVSSFEAMKARNLARHLFRQDIESPIPAISGFSRLDFADRIRADLSGLVRLGAGRYLKEDIFGPITQAPSKR